MVRGKSSCIPIKRGIDIMAKIKVAVIFGGVSSEHSVSLITATNIIQNIPADKYEVIPVGITKKGRWFYYPGDVKLLSTGEWESNPDCVPAVLSPDPIHRGFILMGDDATIKKVDVIFPALHGKNGEDGTIQGLFELSQIPYVGCGVGASSNCMDKELTHTILEANGINMARWYAVKHADLPRLEEICDELENQLGFPMFVKPANAGSSIGVNKAYDKEGLIDSVKFAFAHDSKVIIEEYIKGREIECAVFGHNSKPIASPLGELIPEKDFYDYEAKYVLGSTKLTIPAEIPTGAEKEIRETATTAFSAIGCEGLSRVDFFLREDGEVVLNEINTLPGFTSISMYPKLMENLGIPYAELLDKLIELALEN